MVHPPVRRFAPGRKTTNRLRAIETFVRQQAVGEPGPVARQLIAFGRLKPAGCRGTRSH